MKRSYKLGSLISFGSLAVVAACAQGTADPMPASVDPAQTAAPVEPPARATLPPSSNDDPEEKAQEPTKETPDASTPKPPGNTTPDAGSCTTNPPSNACGLTPQCGCTGNQTCDVTDKTTGAVSCVAAGSGAVGSPCTATGDCATGLTCAYGTCRPYCETANAACSGTGLGKCAQLKNGTAAIPNAKVCTIACDLRNPSPMCGSNTCVWDKTVGTSDCDVTGTKARGAICNGYNDCKPGLACVPYAVNSYCESWCRVGHNEDCTGANESCVDVYGSVAPTQNGFKLGHCE